MSQQDIQSLYTAGVSRYSRHEFIKAEELFRRGADESTRQQLWPRAIRFWNNVGAANLGMFRYGSALTAFLTARDLARKVKDADAEAFTALNLTSVYMAQGDGVAAEGSLREAMARTASNSPYLCQLLAQRARVAFRKGENDLALRLIGDGIRVCQDKGDRNTESQLWENLAMLHSSKGDLEGAEDALANEFRLRRLFKLPNIEAIFIKLGRVRVAQGRPQEALNWFQRASQSGSRNRSLFAPWIRDYDWAVALQASGKTGEALAKLREAWSLATEWRQDVLPAQSTEAAADVSLSDLASRLAGLAAARAAQSADPALLSEAFATVEQNRAAGLRRVVFSKPATREKLGGAYLEALSAWRTATAKSIAEGELAGRLTAVEVALRTRLTEMEARAGIDAGLRSATAVEAPTRVVSRLRSALGADEALFSFLLAEPHSHAWVLTRKGLKHAALPGKSELTPMLEKFREAVAANRPNLEALGAALYRRLFGFAPAEALACERWLLSPDDALYATPLAALRAPGPDGARWLAEAHTLQAVPSSFWLLQTSAKHRPERLLAVGDAIHNRADARFPRSGSSKGLLAFGMLPGASSQPELPPASFELPALPGSARELKAIAGLWGSAGLHAEVLSGVEANEPAVERALSKAPAVVHFATHVVPVERRGGGFVLQQASDEGGVKSRVMRDSGDSLLALSLNRDGSRSGINAGTVASLELKESVVVLNGCSSGLGTIHPGAGLMGFTRAWMAAGARSVVASLWPVADDSGELFKVFYRSLLAGEPASDSLRASQRAMIRSQSWRSQPRYWAAYFLVGKE